MNKITPQTQSIIKLPPSICQQHNLQFQTYCSHQHCNNKIRVCPKCKPNHQHHTKYFTQSKQVIDDLSIGLKRCFDKIEEFDQRSKQLVKLMKLAQSRSKQEYSTMQNNLVQQVKQDRQNIQRRMIKMQEIYNKIEQKQRIKIYFAKLQKSNLLQLRIKLSNQNGMVNFKQKNQKLCQLISKSNFQQFQKLYDQFNKLKDQIDYQLQNNFTFKIGQIITLKNSKKITISKVNNIKDDKQNKNTTKQTKQKQKPKTTLNFGQGIINGILNFLNF